MALISISVISDVEQFYALTIYIHVSIQVLCSFFFSFLAMQAHGILVPWRGSNLCQCIGSTRSFGPLGKSLLTVFESSFLLLLSCGSSFYILDISLFLDTWFINIFFHSVGCSFTLWLFSLMYKGFCYLLFFSVLLVSHPQNPFRIGIMKVLPLCF